MPFIEFFCSRDTVIRLLNTTTNPHQVKELKVNLQSEMKSQVRLGITITIELCLEQLQRFMQQRDSPGQDLKLGIVFFNVYLRFIVYLLHVLAEQFDKCALLRIT